MDVVMAGARRLESWGLRVRLPTDLIEANTFFANSDKKRLAHLKKALLARDSKAVWCVRGGSGTHRLLPDLFKSTPSAKMPPKLVVGFSDITSLHAGLFKHWKWASLHGPVLGQLGRKEGDAKSVIDADMEELRAYIFGEKERLVIPGLVRLNTMRAPKKISGTLLGGNLIVFQTLVGTKDMPRTRGSILFFEEVGERGYRVDRTLIHLKQAGVFDGVKALILGDFIGGDEPGVQAGGTGVNRLHWAFENLTRDLKIPIYRALPVGHGERNLPLLVGARAEIVGKELTCAPLS